MDSGSSGWRRMLRENVYLSKLKSALVLTHPAIIDIIIIINLIILFFKFIKF